MKKVRKGAVLGSGSWGTALATVIAHHADRVALWGRDEAVCAAINARHENPHYLPGIPLDANIAATTDAAEALKDAEVVVVGLPTKALEPVLGRLKDLIPAEVPVVSTSKGIDPDTHRFPSELIRNALGRPDLTRIFVLSGPSFAKETAMKLPTAVAFAGENMEDAEEWAHLFFTPFMRAYPSTDRAGIEVAGALKNVIAVAAGAVDGLGLGANARSAMITRGLSEIQRFGAHYGADPMTFLGLAGMGDLVLTCTGALSRNHRVGELLASGKSLEEALGSLGQVAEGVRTTKSAKELADELELDMPITRQVYAVLFDGKSPKDAVRDLMTRPMHPEH